MNIIQNYCCSGDCELEGPCTPALGKLISTATRLKSLTLSGNYGLLSSPEAVKPLAHALATNKSLTSLSIDYCGLTDDGVAILAESLKQNTTLKEIDFDGNNLTDYGAKSLLAMLAVNTTISSMAIDGDSNSLSDNAVQLIHAALSNRSHAPSTSQDNEYRMRHADLL